MLTKVVKWGNSLGLRIPKSFAEEIRIAAGSEVELSIKDGQLVVEVAPKADLGDLLAKVTEENLHREIETGDPVGGETW